MSSKAMVAVLLSLAFAGPIQADQKDTHHQPMKVAAVHGQSHERAPVKAHEESKPAVSVHYAALAEAPAVGSESRAQDSNEQFTRMVCCP